MIIVKVGGGRDINWDYVCGDLGTLLDKEKIILVHGASAKRNEIAKKLRAPTKYLTSPSGQKSVYTNKEALEILTMVYAGLVNKKVVAKLQKNGVNAVGLSGVDGRIWEGKRKKHLISVEGGRQKLIKNTYTGRINRVNSKLIETLLESGYLPVITQPALSREGELINTDNDLNIAVMAGALQVKKIVVLFEASGFLENLNDEKSVVKKITKEKLPSLMNNAKGTMKKKVLGAIEALENGVEIIYWGDGRVKNPIKKALAGKGTVIK